MDVTMLNTAMTHLVSSEQGGSTVDLADRASAAFASAVERHDTGRAGIVAAINDPRTASSPEAVIGLQMAAADHMQMITLAAALANDVVKGVETLVKS